MMRTPDFELSFEVTGLTEDIEDAIEETFDLVVATHGRTTVVTLLVPGRSAVDAAHSALAILRQHHIGVQRLVEDLVTRAEIAERADVTTQAVGLWARGERNTAIPFPEPYIRAGSATLWLWGEVADYLRETGDQQEDEELSYPTRQEIVQITALLAPLPESEPNMVVEGVGFTNFGCLTFSTARAATWGRASGAPPEGSPYVYRETLVSC